MELKKCAGQDVHHAPDVSDSEADLDILHSVQECQELKKAKAHRRIQEQEGKHWRSMSVSDYLALQKVSGACEHNAFVATNTFLLGQTLPHPPRSIQDCRTQEASSSALVIGSACGEGVNQPADATLEQTDPADDPSFQPQQAYANLRDPLRFNRVP